ncbi:MAG: LytTR family transcriptional regulator DNA-binding domain-containing protein [Clostridiales Family XIII bacterium]|jgi:DNA-binding LytR/AlgR family response regulator|nr:LytTR family transcriptional regulator DNA-binding domain-containing protein [Clostridiales Family XIII bacterium]
MSAAFQIRNRFEFALLPIRETLFVQKNNRRVLFFSETKDYWSYAKFNEVMMQADASFFICHSRLAVNLNRIYSIRGGMVTFSGGMQVKMCRSALRRTKKAWSNFIAE